MTVQEILESEKRSRENLFDIHFYMEGNFWRVGFYRFKQILEDKAKNNYKEVVFVGRFYPSSKTCHKCGYVNRELTLNDREWTCPRCGEHHDRDLNAAINILLEGERIMGNRVPN